LNSCPLISGGILRIDSHNTPGAITPLNHFKTPARGPPDRVGFPVITPL